MIATKSVSRFGRKLIDCISWVRGLKEQNPPVAVLFEQKILNTLDSTSNISLFVLAMVAEEESHRKRETMLLSLKWRFSRSERRAAKQRLLRRLRLPRRRRAKQLDKQHAAEDRVHPHHPGKRMRPGAKKEGRKNRPPDLQFILHCINLTRLNRRLLCSLL